MSENIITISNAFKFASKNNRNKYSQTNYQFIITSDIANIIKISWNLIQILILVWLNKKYASVY